MKTLPKLLILTMLFCLLPAAVFAQESPKAVVVTHDGCRLSGVLIKQSSQEVELQTENIGLVTIPRENIRTMEIEGEEVKQETDAAAIMPPRYFATTNGYPLGKGKLVYDNFVVMGHQLGYGVTSNFSVAAGFASVFLVGLGLDETPYAVNARYAFPIKTDKVNASLGAFVMGVGNETQFGGYGNLTIGKKSSNLNLGLIYSSTVGDPLQVASVSFILPVGKRTFLMSENYFSLRGENDYGPGNIVSLGLRSVVSHVSLSYGLFTSFGQSDFIGLPYIAISVPINKP